MRPSQHLKTGTAIVLAVSALAAPAAAASSARVVHPNPDEWVIPTGSTYSAQDKQLVSNAPSPASTPAPAPATPSTIVHVAAPGGGFDWGDAGIGAAGGLGLSVLGLGGALALSQRRARRSGRSTVVSG